MTHTYDPPDPPEDEELCEECDEPLSLCWCHVKTEPEDYTGGESGS